MFSKLIRAFYKLVIGPIKYKSVLYGYDAKRYWDDRYSKFGMSNRGPKQEGRSERENNKTCLNDVNQFYDLCKRKFIKTNNVLDIGCGTGLYTEHFKRIGTKKYTGIDITDYNFGELKKDFPGYSFIERDICSDVVYIKSDLIIMMDVVQHIVNPGALEFAFQNVKQCLNDDGVFIIGPLNIWERKMLFYMRSWGIKYISDRFNGYVTSTHKFRDGYALIIGGK